VKGVLKDQLSAAISGGKKEGISDSTERRVERTSFTVAFSAI
jgi:hypothetical protein